MIGTEFLNGQGLGNQLFCYISTRCIAIDTKKEFGTVNQDLFAKNIHSQQGMYFMDIDLGNQIDKSLIINKYHEKDERLFLKTCVHDRTHGCYVAGYDQSLLNIQDNTLIYGNLQSEKYFIHHKDKIKEWLKIKPEYDTNEYTSDDLCILNMRGGEYVGLNELYLGRKYWINGIKNMRRINPAMKFMIITDDVISASRLLPEIKAYHFELAKDYAIIKNAKYLLLSNSSFAFFPAFTSETVEFIIAPKYWARHNISNGYWASEQNIYSGWRYQDRSGRLFSASDCNVELDNYKKRKHSFLSGKREVIS